MTLQLKCDSKRRTIISLALKYDFEEKHALFVEEISLQIFDLLRETFRLSDEDRIIMSHAALLHDIGSFINSKKHHKYSKYIIEHDNILKNYNPTRKNILSLIVFNHRKKLHKKTVFLAKSSRSTVLRLSAILRIADALDNTRKDISINSISMDDGCLFISVSGDLSERLQRKVSTRKALFRDIFGLDVALVMH